MESTGPGLPGEGLQGLDESVTAPSGDDDSVDLPDHS
jgi:hypothetical protein